MRGILLLIVAFSSLVKAQQIIIIDSITREPIPHASIYDGKTGVIANSAGVFYWDNADFDHFTLSCLGYKSKIIPATKLNDTPVYAAQSGRTFTCNGQQSNSYS